MLPSCACHLCVHATFVCMLPLCACMSLPETPSYNLSCSLPTTPHHIITSSPPPHTPLPHTTQYNVVGFRGSGSVSYGTAVTSVLFCGIFFVILSVSGVRGKLIKSMPKSLLLAITAGIGMFLTHLGLQQADGLGLVTYQSATLVTLGMWCCSVAVLGVVLVCSVGV